MSDSTVTHRKSNGVASTKGATPDLKSEQHTADKFSEWLYWLTFSLPPNIKTLRLKYYANFQKSTMTFYMLFLMWYFNNYSLGCWVYTALHGSYGFLWNLKTMAFPDKSHEDRVSIGSLPMLFTALTGYWYIPYMMASGQSEQNPSHERIFWSVMIYAVGAALMMVSDAQKYFVLNVKRGLIADGMFAHSRNPNYLGEMMIYSTFALISNRMTPWYILLTMWICVFSPFFVMKELSFRRKAGWEEYKKRSYILLPKIFGSDILSIGFYGFALFAGWKIYNMGGLFVFLKSLH